MELTFDNSSQTGWSIPVELIIGPDVGISYTASQAGSQVCYSFNFIINWMHNYRTISKSFCSRSWF